ncbi:MAG: tRNA (guanosine(37)-N1)-methyltransferase TrmD [Chlamydiales bacterium]|nr:tRNA (guanosine(37)-N1)-methyltransferase TrmD [Chlamydiales bacterium]
MEIDILSLFPEYFQGPFDVSIIKRAKEKNLLSIRHKNIRDFAADKHKTVDDRPYGGGPGMVMKPEPVIDAIRSVKTEKSHVIMLSPQGRALNAAKCIELAQKQHLIFVCGHYEGIDERVNELEIDEEISIGDYVLTNGCLAAIVVIDAMARFIPGVIGNEQGAWQDSFMNNAFDTPHYTRPPEFEGLKVPEVLLHGNHAEIKKWREEQAQKKTKLVRPDLMNEKGQEDESSAGN